MRTPFQTERTSRIFLVACITICLVVGALWLPFGLQRTLPQFESWTIVYKMLRGENPLFDFTNTTRPMVFAPFTLLFLLKPYALVAFNLAFITLFISKGLLLFGLLRRLLPDQPFLAFFSALLFIIYPADQAVMSFRATNVQTSLVPGLAAIYLLVVTWQHPRWWQWPLIWLLQLTTLLMYEVMYPLFLVSPLLLWWLDRHFSKRLFRVALQWWLIPAPLFLNVLMVLRAPSNNYLGDLIHQSAEQHLTSPARLVEAIIRMYQRHLSEWSYAWEWLTSEYTVLTVVVGVIVALTSWWVIQHSRATLSWKQLLLIILVGIVVMFLGYAPFLTGPTQLENWRVYLTSAIGAALIVAVVLDILRKIPRLGTMLASVGSGVVVILAFAVTLHQHQFFVETSDTIRHLTRSIIALAPELDLEASVVVVDTPGVFASGWLLASSPWALSGALDMAYGDIPIEAYICSGVLGFEQGFVCEFQDDGLALVHPEQQAFIPYERLILFSKQPDGSVNLIDQLENSEIEGASRYQPHKLIQQEAAQPVSIPVTPSCPQSSEGHLIIQFDHPTLCGEGWYEQEVNRSSRAMRSAHASLIVLPPLDRGDLHIRFHITSVVDRSVLPNLTLSVNGYHVVLQKQQAISDTVVTGVIPKEALLPETILEFTTRPARGDVSWTLVFDWLEIEPV
ncbi:MAG: hypothetical protein K8L99_06965 [Anaerolineae bacterium]|nr:hypothetical protein [Anaerolineae bacterium]